MTRSNKLFRVNVRSKILRLKFQLNTCKWENPYAFRQTTLKNIIILLIDPNHTLLRLTIVCRNEIISEYSV